MTQTLQLDVEELFANLLDWDTPKPAQQQPQPAAEQQREQQADAAHSTAQQPAAVDSKKLCGNVESDQPGGLQARQLRRPTSLSPARRSSICCTVLLCLRISQSLRPAHLKPHTRTHPLQT